MPLFAVCGSAGGGAGADEEGPRKRALFVSQSQDLEHFQFETLRISNHTACRFAEKTRFFRSLLAGRRCAAASRFRPGGAVPPPRVSPFSKLKRSSFEKGKTFMSKKIYRRREKLSSPA